MELHNTNVNMDGLLEVLGRNLYSTPSVAIRELVQNAHDACIRRKIEQTNQELPIFSTHLEANSESKTIEIHDNPWILT